MKPSQGVTELGEAKDRDRASESRFRDAFENAPIGLAILDRESRRPRIVDANRAMGAICGIEPASLSGLELEPLIAEPVGEPDLDQRRRLLAGEEDTYEFESTLVHSGGHRILCQISATIGLDASGGEPRGVLQIQDISERRRLEERLRYQADHDSLTGLANRRRFGAELESAVARTIRYGGTGAVLIIDIDGLKAINDSQGHVVGDDLLRHVARVLGVRTRETDIVARLSGDEFAVLMPEADADGARHLAEDLRLGIGEVEAVASEAAVTASIGVALFGVGHAESAEAVLHAADRAMYAAKAEGRNRIAIHGDGVG